MFPHVVEARHTEGHSVWVRFDNGASGEIDLSDVLDGSIFEPLCDVEYFKRFSLEGHTLAWPNGADFAPEFLYEKLHSKVVV